MGGIKDCRKDKNQKIENQIPGDWARKGEKLPKRNGKNRGNGRRDFRTNKSRGSDHRKRGTRGNFSGVKSKNGTENPGPQGICDQNRVRDPERGEVPTQEQVN